MSKAKSRVYSISLGLWTILVTSVFLNCSRKPPHEESQNRRITDTITIPIEKSYNAYFPEIKQKTYIKIVGKYRYEKTPYLRAEGHVMQKEKIGLWKEYFSDSTLKLESTYFLTDSLYLDTVYNEQPNGDFTPELLNRQASLLDGEQIEYDHGIVIRRTNFIQGIKHGLEQTFDDEGKLSSEQYYENGVGQEQIIHFYEGSLHLSGRLTDGPNLFYDTTYTENLETREFEPVIQVFYESVKDSIWSVQDQEGNILYHLRYSKGIIQDTIY